MKKDSKDLMSFGEHLEVLRIVLIRIIAACLLCSVVVFCFKTIVFNVLLAPADSSFITYKVIEDLARYIGIEFSFSHFNYDLIAIDVSSQFLMHVITSLYLGLLLTSPWILYQLFRFISPALLENERRYSIKIAVGIYFLFVIGILLNYFIIFPFSFRFLANYNVSNKVETMITLDSYISTFLSLSIIMGVVFQLPMISFILSKMGIITSDILAKYRKHAIIILMFLAAIITPPDIMSLILVSFPLYLLYELSIKVIK